VKIKKGHRVRFHQESAETGLVATDVNDPESAWYVKEFGGGFFLDPLVSGRTFIPAGQLDECEDLEFVSRADSQ
jgi:hypothetical protein